MAYSLGNNVKVGNKILLKTGWKKITVVKADGVEVSGNFIPFGAEVCGWKSK